MRVIKLHMDIETNIKKIRLKKGITQERLARTCNVSTRTIQNAEREVNKNIEIVYKIKEALGCSLDDLYSVKK